MRKALLIVLALVLVASVFVSCSSDPETVTITFNPGEAPTQSPYTQKVIVGLDTQLSKNKFTYEGYSLVGWSMSPTGGLDFQDEGTINTDKDLNLYAVWSLDYHITIVPASGGSLESAVHTYIVSDNNQAIGLNFHPDENYYLEKISLEGSGNTSAFVLLFSLLIPADSTGDIVITPTFKYKPDNVNYVDADWNNTSVVLTNKSVSSANYSLVSKKLTKWSAGYYVV